MKTNENKIKYKSLVHVNMLGLRLAITCLQSIAEAGMNACKLIDNNYIVPRMN